MALSAEQDAYVGNVSDSMDLVGDAISQLEQWSSIYTDRSYGVGGSREITDADLVTAGHEFTANDLANGVALMNALVAFRDNLAVATAAYGQTINTLRALS